LRLDPEVVGVSFKLLQAFGLVEAVATGLQLTDSGRDLLRNIGYFTWMVGGYGNMLLHLSERLRVGSEYGRLLERDGQFIAQAGSEYGPPFVDRYFFETLDRLSFQCVADLGCGSAKRLMAICNRYRNASGIGIDVDEGACTLARVNVRESGLDKRVTIIPSDLRALLGEEWVRGKCADADLVTCFFLLHELFTPDHQEREVLLQLKEAFPSAKQFLIADTMVSDADKICQEPTIFSLGFELTHAVMKQTIRPKSYYDELFRMTGFVIQDVVELGIAYSWLYILKP